MNNPFDYIPDEECDKAFRRLLDRLDALAGSEKAEDVNFCKELREGKMLGVLIAEDSHGNRHTLYAFSGQLGCGGFHRNGFVGPVFDYLRPDGYFKTHEADISRQNVAIAEFQSVQLAQHQREYDHAKCIRESEISAFREQCRTSKSDRDAKRAAGVQDESELADMLRQSQFEKAELRRLKKRLANELQPFEERLNASQRRLKEMKEKRRRDSEALQNWLFRNFTLLNARGERKSLLKIFSDTAFKIPPSGAGECCAPKLLQTAYERGWVPLAMAEYWYGTSKSGEVRLHGHHYPACRGKCGPVLNWMLQGLEICPPLENRNDDSLEFNPEIIYENQWFCVVNKPSGMLSVPGKGRVKSLQQWLEERYGRDREVKVAHRLDRDTSGLVVAAFGHVSFKLMQSLFATRKIKKTYIADLEGDYIVRGMPRRGRIALPLMPDYLDRPRQRVDIQSGKEAVTDYEFIGVTDGCSRIIFHPLTGRTHQLRVHSASGLGLGMPIVGDRLYGDLISKGNERLHLHAWRIEFTFSVDNEFYSFESPSPF